MALVLLVISFANLCTVLSKLVLSAAVITPAVVLVAASISLIKSVAPS